jgi:hypothetical protein
MKDLNNSNHYKNYKKEGYLMRKRNSAMVFLAFGALIGFWLGSSTGIDSMELVGAIIGAFIGFYMGDRL